MAFKEIQLNGNMAGDSGGGTWPAWVYLDGQLMREWVSPSASVWRNQSVFSFALALCRWKPDGRHVSEWMSKWVCRYSNGLDSAFLLCPHTQTHHCITHTIDFTLSLTRMKMSLATSRILLRIQVQLSGETFHCYSWCWERHHTHTMKYE